MVNRIPGQFLSADKTSQDIILTLPSTFTTTTYTFTLSDINGYKLANNAAAITVTVPKNSSVSFPPGAVLTLEQTGAGQVTFVADTGVTINSAGGLLATSAQKAVVSLLQTSINTWTLFGNLA